MEGKEFGNKENSKLGRKVDLLLRTGKLLVESSADTNRIERNMKRVAAYMGIPEEKLHLNISFTMLQVNVSDGNHSFTKFQKCTQHKIDMTAISAVSKLSWRAIEDDYSLEEYEKQLEEIKRKKGNFTRLAVIIGAGFACGGFCKLFGCDWIAFFFASACASVGFWVRQVCGKFGFNQYVNIAIAAFVSTCLAYLTHFTTLSSTPMHPLLACALFIVPGVPLINFVDDMVDNFISVGITRAVNTLLMMCSMAFGIMFAIKLCKVQDFITTSMVPHSSFVVYGIAAAVAAMGFSMIFNIPRRLLWVVAVGGIIAVCTRNFFTLVVGWGAALSTFMGAFVVSIIALKAVHWVHVPNHVLTIPSVIPMVPGVLMYRLLLGLMNINSKVGLMEITPLLKALESGVNSGLIILCIALGVAVPNIFGRRFVAKSKQRRLNEMLSDRRARGKFLDW